jgi:DNA repair exonuclease SbcCD ATPase subunit
VNYDLITKASAFTVIALILVFVLKNFMSGANKERENYQKLVNGIRKESKEREDKLMVQLDKCTTSLQENTDSLKEISKNMQVIPVMQEELKAIPTMQADISYLKKKVK